MLREIGREIGSIIFLALIGVIGFVALLIVLAIFMAPGVNANGYYSSRTWTDANGNMQTRSQFFTVPDGATTSSGVYDVGGGGNNSTPVRNPCGQAFRSVSGDDAGRCYK